jgi:8-oxo-dGTP pyrophosphatase MutT (NUDIX family)
MSDAAIPVVAAVIRRDGRYLLGRRPEHKRHGGLWEFPGGKVLAGESRFDAARRELAEELGLEVDRLGALLHAVRDPGAPYVIEFVEVVARGEPAALEHSSVGWFSAAELRGLALAPADAVFARTVSERAS